MRLIQTSTLTLHHFHDQEIPEFAALSHTWGAEEITFQEFESKSSTHKFGYEKVSLFCSLCVQRNIQWAWADTVCIDKTNSAELSEAINSMFLWYRRSIVCFAYLDDLSQLTGPDPSSWEEHFKKSKWFTRGWTLQELLAPNNVEFYTQQWVKIGDKLSLQKLLTELTGIDASYLKASKNIGLACIAQKMAWASKRQTTREEDRAYCLLGLFRVNMPLLYGEGGTRAFLRLQEEILKVSADHTIFAWFANAEAFPEGVEFFRECSSGLLAPSPSFFAASYNVRRRLQEFRIDKRFLALGSQQPYQMTNRGLQIELPLTRWKCDDEKCGGATSCQLAVLNCYCKRSWNTNTTLKHVLTALPNFSQREFNYECCVAHPASRV